MTAPLIPRTHFTKPGKESPACGAKHGWYSKLKVTDTVRKITCQRCLTIALGPRWKLEEVAQ